MVVGGKERLGTCPVMDVFDDGLSQGHPIIGRRPPSQLIKQDERSRSRLANGIVGLHHLNHKGRLAGHQVICSPNPGINGIKEREGRRLSRYKGTNLSHNDNDGQLAHIGGLPAHIGPRNQLDITGLIHRNAVGDVALSSHNLLNNWVTTLLNPDITRLLKDWPGQLLSFSYTGQPLQDVHRC